MKKFVFSLFLTLTAFCVLAQDTDNKDYADPTQPLVDSILALITPDMPDTAKARQYRNIGKISGTPDTVLKYSTLSLEYCNDSDWQLLSDNYDFISWSYYMKNEPRPSLDNIFKALSFSEKLNEKKLIANCYVSIAKCYSELNYRDSTFHYFNKAVDIYTEINDTAELAYTLRSIGFAKQSLGFTQSAIEYYTKAVELDSAVNNITYLAGDYKYLGMAMNDKRRTLVYLKKSLSLLEPINDDYYANIIKNETLQGLASTYMKIAKETNVKEYADSAYIYIKRIGNTLLQLGEYDYHLIICQIYAEYLSFYGKNKEALNVLLENEKYLDDDVNNNEIAEYYELLSEIYTKLGEYKKALACYKKMHEYKTAYVNDSTLNVLADFQTEQTVKIHEAEKRELEAETHRLETIRSSLIIGLVLVLSVVVLIFRMLIIRRKANEELLHKNQKLDQQNAEILAQREEIEAQRDVITNQWHEVDNINKKLIDSINYARRIQYAAISLKTEVDKVFPRNMVFYRPCDIVSGDFYRVAQCGKYRVLIIADCTGHGIPGAFLSMLGISALKEFCVTEEDAANPGTILDRMRNFIKSTLVSDLKDAIDESMDMTICSFDLEAMEMRYAIANQTAFVIRDGKAIKLQGDRMPVGRYIIEKEHFTTQTIPLQKGDAVYCFSDGIQDQLGGDSANEIGEKFLQKNLINFLTDNYDKPFDTQQKLLDKTITNWSNGRPQIDDMTLIGIKV
ncbi:MAG: SpoIIE family protein phosphatase [Salinivirgaceae bacterium]|nr:SpoIIE family protein phosphatase [Salinivirgaceae bacterium]